MRRSVPWYAAALAAMLLAGCSSSMTPLHRAAVAGDVDVVKSYVREKRNLDPRWDEPTRGLEGNYARLIGLTPLMLAARGGNLEITRLLLEGGADPHLQANTQLPGDPRSAFDFAVESGKVAVAEYLWKKSDGARIGGRLAGHISLACIAYCKEGFPKDASSNMALFLIAIAPEAVAGSGVGAAACSSPQPLETLAFVERHAARPPRNTLHCIAYQTFGRHRPFAERKAILTWMLDHGAQVDGQQQGWTPLRGAASAHDIDTARLLVERGANANFRGADGLPPIAGAANTCVHAPKVEAADARLDAQLAMVQYLAAISDRNVYASAEVRSKASLLGDCCSRRPQAQAQRRICEVFGL
jgi:ankyrin repeat protein